MSETNVSVRFSVQDSETVRRALEQLGTDGQKALDKLNAAGQAPAAGLKAVSSVMEDLKSRATGLAFSLGPIGTGLVQLGPIGLIAGAGLGLVAAAIGHVIDEANRLGSVSQGLRNLSDTTALAGTALQGLVNAGGQLGIEGDKVTNSLERFTSQLDQVHQATGPLYDQILKVNPLIADQMVRTRDAATAWNLLAQAYTAADTAQRAAIARAAFGRGGIGTGRLLEATAAAGGIDAISAQNTNVLTDQQIKKFAELKSKIDETNKTAKDLMASIWTQEVLDRELQAAEAFERIAKAAKDTADQQSGMSWLSKLMDNIARADMAGAGVPYPAPPQTKLTVGQSPSVWAGEGGAGAFTPDKETAEAALNKMRTWMAILGPAATSTQQLNLRQAELNAAVEKAGGQYGNLAARAQEYYRVQIAGADIQIRIQNDVANAGELYMQRQRELDLLVHNQKLTQDEANQSLKTYADKILPDIIRQEEQRRSLLPGLTKYAQDAANLNLNLDQLGTSVSGNVVTGLADMTSGTMKFSDGLRNMAATVGRTIEEMLLKMTVGRATAMAFNAAFSSWLPSGVQGVGNGLTDTPGNATGLFTGPAWQPGFPAASANGNVFSGGNIVPFRVGGIIRRPTLFAMANGGTGLAGEAGSEEGILPLTRIGGKLGVHATGGGAQVINNITIEDHGADVSEKSRSQNDSGGLDLVLMVRSITDQNLSSGKHDKALAGRGFRRQVGQPR